jgi:hypothetical protein
LSKCYKSFLNRSSSDVLLDDEKEEEEEEEEPSEIYFRKNTEKDSATFHRFKGEYIIIFVAEINFARTVLDNADRYQFFHWRRGFHFVGRSKFIDWLCINCRKRMVCDC